MTKEKQKENVKPKKIKPEKYRSDDQMEMIRFIRILIIVVVLIIGIYFFTRIFVTKDLINEENNNDSVVEGVINYDVTMIGSLLNKPEEEYYVMIYNTENIRSVYYSSLMSNYNENEDALKIYFADLDKELNAKFYDPEHINLMVSNISDLKVGDLTLIRVENGQIAEAFSDEEEIANELAYIESEDTEN